MIAWWFLADWVTMSIDLLPSCGYLNIVCRDYRYLQLLESAMLLRMQHIHSFKSMASFMFTLQLFNPLEDCGGLLKVNTYWDKINYGAYSSIISASHDSQSQQPFQVLNEHLLSQDISKEIDTNQDTLSSVNMLPIHTSFGV